MPMVRYLIRNEYGLADPGLYGVSVNNDPEALLEGVAMAGLVGILRQLGDLAEFASEVFHDLNEEVVATASRGHRMMLRVQRVEAELPQVTHTFLSQTSRSLLKCNTGIKWHPDIQIRQNLMTKRDMPGFISNSFEACRGPPRLPMLDKFDVAGVGACLKRYTDPLVFRTEFASFETMESLNQHERKPPKTKFSMVHGRNGENNGSFAKPDVNSRQNDISLGKAVGVVSRKRIKLKKKPKDYLDTSIKSYIECVMARQSDQNSEEFTSMKDTVDLSGTDSEVHGSDTDSESNISMFDQQNQTSSINSQELTDGLTTKLEKQVVEGTESAKFLQSSIVNDSVDYIESEFTGSSYDDSANESEISTFHEVEQMDLLSDPESNKHSNGDGCITDDASSDLDQYTDATTNMRPEKENDIESGMTQGHGFLDTESQGGASDKDEEKQDLHVQCSDSHYTENLKTLDMNNLFRKERTNLSRDSLGILCDTQPSDRHDLSDCSSGINGSNNLPENMTTSSGEILGCMNSKMQHGNSQVTELESPDNILHDGICNAKSLDTSSFEKKPKAFTDISKDEARKHSNLSSISMVSHSNVDAVSTEPHVPSSGLKIKESTLKDNNAGHDSSLTPSHRDSGDEINLQEEHGLHDNMVQDQHVHIRETSTSDICQIGASPADATEFNTYPLDGGQVSDTKSPPGDHGICVNLHEEVYSVPQHNLEITGPPGSESHGVLIEHQMPNTCGYQKEIKKASQQHVSFNHVASKSLVDIPDQAAATLTIFYSEPNIAHPHGRSYSESDIIHGVGKPALVRDGSNQDKGNKLVITPSECSLGSNTKSFPHKTDIDDTVPSNNLFLTVDSRLQPGIDFNKTSLSLEKEGSLDTHIQTGNVCPLNTVSNRKSVELDVPVSDASNQLAVQPCLPSQSGSNCSVKFSENTPYEALPPFSSFTPINSDQSSEPHEGGSAVSLSPPHDNALQVAEHPHGLAEEKVQSSNPFILKRQNQLTSASTRHDGSSEYASRNLEESSGHPSKPSEPMSKSGHEESQNGDPNLPAYSLLPSLVGSTEENKKAPRVTFRPMSDTSDVALPEIDAQKANGKPCSILDRPRDPLMESVAAHDRSTMRKVSEMFQAPTIPKVDGMNKLLEQIRNKNFNLKPAAAARPNISIRPVTNLKLAAMLEKANTIRLALAGSDEDDDDDNWD